jgi:murein DD-endopeptidase MepM/ murein hydrolase activator NlpD
LRRLASICVLCTSFAACATGRPSSWEEDAMNGVAKTAPVVHLQATEKGSELRDTPRVAIPEGPRDTRHLELLLMKFTTQRRAISKESSRAPSWPPQMQALWIDMLARLESGLSGSEPVSPRLLIQARVTTEAERDMTEQKFGACPDNVKALIDKLFLRIARHMDQARTPAERLRIVQRPELVWPVAPVIVTSAFGYRRDPITDEIRFHAGVDLYGSKGDLVSAAGPGKVIYAGWLGGYGRAVIVQHPGGYQTVYGHMSQILIPLDVEVDAGSPLGFMGSSGRSTGPHLHFEVRQAGVAIDPHDAIGLQLLSLAD